MRYSLLEIVQEVASSMDSDDISSISDSTESLQIAHTVRQVYYDIVGRGNLPEHYLPFQLDQTAAASPTIMITPQEVQDIKWVKYNCVNSISDPVNMQLIQPLQFDEFIARMHLLSTNDTNVSSFTNTLGTASTFTFYYNNDRNPSFYTTFDDSSVVFDAINTNVDSFLTSAKTYCYGRKYYTFTLADTFTPLLDEDQFTLLLNEVKTLAWAELKQSPHPVADRNSRRGWTHLQNKKYRVAKPSAFDQLPNFGRC